MVFMGRGIEVAEGEISSLKTGYRPDPEEARQKRLRVGRQVINRGIYMHPGHPSPDRVVGGIEKSLPLKAKKFVESKLGQAVLRRPASLRAWRAYEQRGSASESVTALLREVNPDVVLVSPSIWPKNPVEADYIYAAKKLGIPTIGYLNSWDNLTSKGTVHVLPGRVHRLERGAGRGSREHPPDPAQGHPGHGRAAPGPLLRHGADAVARRRVPRARAPRRQPVRRLPVQLAHADRRRDAHRRGDRRRARGPAGREGAEGPRPPPSGQPGAVGDVRAPGRRHLPQARRPGGHARVVAGVLQPAHVRQRVRRPQHDRVPRGRRRRPAVHDDRLGRVLRPAGPHRALPPPAGGGLPRGRPRRRRGRHPRRARARRRRREGRRPPPLRQGLPAPARRGDHGPLGRRRHDRGGRRARRGGERGARRC